MTYQKCELCRRLLWRIVARCPVARFAWLKNQVESAVRGVESFGMSSAFTYIGEDRAECVMSSPFVNIEDAPEASREQRSDRNNTEDVTAAMERLAQERRQQS